MESPAAGVMLPRSGESEFWVWLLSSRIVTRRYATRHAIVLGVGRLARTGNVMGSRCGPLMPSGGLQVVPSPTVGINGPQRLPITFPVRASRPTPSTIA